jgi:hypothetical protein
MCMSTALAAFGVYLSCASARAWSSAKRTLTAAGFTIRQNGDMDGTALFDHADAQQARLALKIARIRKRRVLTPEQRQKMAGQLQSVKRGVSAARNGDHSLLDAPHADSPCRANSGVTDNCAEALGATQNNGVSEDVFAVGSVLA